VHHVSQPIDLAQGDTDWLFEDHAFTDSQEIHGILGMTVVGSQD
jgi:hypothetical protein